MAAGVLLVSTLLVGCMAAVEEGFSPIILGDILPLIDSGVFIERREWLVNNSQGSAGRFDCLFVGEGDIDEQASGSVSK